MRVSQKKYREVLTEAFKNLTSHGPDQKSDDQNFWLAALLLSLRIDPESKILAIGTGNGCDAEFFLRNGHSVTGLDVIFSNRWQGLLNLYPSRSFHHTGFLEELNQSSTYDAILDNGNLHHQHPNSVDPYLKAVLSSLKPGGLYGVTVNSALNPAFDHRLTILRDGRFSRTFSKKELAILLLDRGFEVVELIRLSRPSQRAGVLVGLFRKPGI